MKLEYNIVRSTAYKTDKGKAMMKVEGMENINDKTYFKVSYVYADMPGWETETYYYRKSEEGIYTIDGRDMSFPEFLDIKFPLEVGSTWSGKSPLGDFTCTIESIEDLDIFEKKYKDCVKANTSWGKAQGTGYLAKNIGLLKQVIRSAGETTEITLASD